MPPLVWLLLGLGMCAAELLTLDLVLLMLGAAALVTAAAALGVDALALQLVVFAGASAVLLAGVRPVARRHLTSAPALPHGGERLHGRTAMVVEHVGPDSGQVRVDGELWRARPYAGGADLRPGTTAVIAAVEGATALVYPSSLGEVT